MTKWKVALILVIPMFAWGQATSGSPPKIQSLLKPSIYERVAKDREIMTHANLEAIPGSSLRKYSYYATLFAHASQRVSYDTLTNYALYAKLVPYVDRAIYSPITHILELQGGIFGFILHTWIRFEERSDSWVHFEMVAGHFQGMSGNVYFEPQGEKGTLVYLEGQQIQEEWPPRFVMEKGAEIVFGFTASRMRSYIESKPKTESQDHGAVPQPRTRIPSVK